MKVIVSGWVWLPVDELEEHQLSNLRRELTVFPKKTTDIEQAKDPEPILLYREDHDRRMLGIPRGFYQRFKTLFHQEEFDVSMGAPMRQLETTWEPTGPFVEQAVIVEALLKALSPPWGAALLQAQCGVGKTCCAIEVARRLARRTLILVHQEFLLDQWRERIEEFVPDARVGVIRQRKCEYKEIGKGGEKPDFVVGLLQSLARDDGRKYPEEMYSRFGLIVGDEGHRVAAPTWGDVIPRFNAAYRLLLTATPRRKDRAERVFFEHVSKPTYVARTVAQVPKIRYLYTGSILRPIRRGTYRVDIPNLNSAQIINQVSRDPIRTRYIADDVVQAVKRGRKIMIVSERLEHLRDLAREISGILFSMELPFVPTLDFYTGEWFVDAEHKKKRTREELKKAESANVLLCTKQMCVDGNSIVTDADTGHPMHVREVQPGTRILSYRESDGCIHPVRVAKTWESGKRRILSLGIGRGGKRSVKKIRVTGDHKVLTQRGWIRADEAVIGDWLMVPRRFETDKKTSTIDPADAALLGYLIGDGCVSQIGCGVASFTNIDRDIVNRVSELLGRHGASLIPHGQRDVAYRIHTGGKRGARSKSPFRLLMERHGIAGCRAWEKCLSEELLWADARSAGALLGGLISTDGTVCVRQFAVIHSSSSMILAYQLQHLLLRHGIVSFVNSAKGSKSKPRTQWRLSISGEYWVRRFADFVTDLCPRKRARLDMCLSRKSAEGGFGRRVPEEHWAHAMRVWRMNGFEKRHLTSAASGIGMSVHRNGIDMAVVERLAERVDDPTVARWIEGDGAWERICLIEDGGIVSVCDLQMEQNGNFICDGVVVHNCQEGFDVQALDVIVLATPLSDVEQAVGRVRRWCLPSPEKCRRLCPWRAGTCQGKPTPIVVDVVDEQISILAAKARRRVQFYKTLGSV